MNSRRMKSQEIIFAGIVAGDLMECVGLKQYVQSRPEFQVLRVSVAHPQRSHSVLRTTATCKEDVARPVEWVITYFTSKCGTVAAKMLQIMQFGSHAHSGKDVDSGKIFAPQVLTLPTQIVNDTPNKELTLRSFQFQLSQRLRDAHNEPHGLPNNGQQASWLKRAKSKKGQQPMDLSGCVWLARPCVEYSLAHSGSTKMVR